MSLGVSFVVRGTVVDDPDEVDTAEIALEGESDKLGKGRALVLGLKGMIALWVEDECREHTGSRVSTGGRDGYSFKGRGVTISLAKARSEAQTPSRRVLADRGFALAGLRTQVPCHRWVSVGG